MFVMGAGGDQVVERGDHEAEGEEGVGGEPGEEEGAQGQHEAKEQQEGRGQGHLEHRRGSSWLFCSSGCCYRIDGEAQPVEDLRGQRWHSGAELEGGGKVEGVTRVSII